MLPIAVDVAVVVVDDDVFVDVIIDVIAIADVFVVGSIFSLSNRFDLAITIVKNVVLYSCLVHSIQDFTRQVLPSQRDS